MEEVIDQAASDIVIFDRKMKEEKDYWLKRLSRDINPSNLTPDQPGLMAHCGQPAAIELNLEGETFQKLCRLTGEGPFLIYTTLMAALKICFHKYTGRTSVIIGSPGLKGENDPPGAVNMVAILDDVEESITFRQFLLTVRQTLLDAYARQQYPFERVVKDLQLNTQDNKCPLFDTVLVLTNIHSEPPNVNNGVTITFTKEAGGIAGKVIFNSALFKSETVERLCDHFVNVLKAALENPNSLIRDLHILSQSERHQLIFAWNDTAREYPGDTSVVDLIEAQAERAPNAVAVVSRDQQITYKELNERANQLAHHLQMMSVGPEATVCICMRRSAEMVIGMLAVLKTGAAYVPMDPAYPKQRLTFMLEDSHAKALLTESRLADDPAEYDAALVCMDRDWEVIARHSTANPSRKLEAENLAYVIYTSGSTGKPKGVGIQHASLMNLVTWHVNDYRVTPADRASQSAGLAFDGSVWELWPYLSAGASIHIPDEEVYLSPSSLVQWLVAQKITLCFLPTPLAKAVMDESWPPEFALRALLTGGDRLQAAPRKSTPFSFINHYGPTESTVVTTSFPIPQTADSSLPPPIGRPIANIQTYILNSSSEPLPVGVPGELYIGGDGLARCYINQPAMTAERFLPDPFSQKGGQRLYKTGDLARYLPDGNIEFLGRIDHQVKVRGFRIELGEIEAEIARHEAVREAVVLAHEDVPGDNRLTAYVVSRGKDYSVSQLRSFLKERLPDHMLPSYYVTLSALPLTPNGKIDVRALQSLDRSGHEPDGVYAAPRNPLEEVLVGIWAEILRLDEVGINDSFFDLGGHSLIATQALSRIRDILQVELPLRSIFDTPTASGLAKTIERALKAKQKLNSPPILPVKRDRVIPLSFAQQRVWFLDKLEPDSSFYSVPAAVRLDGYLNLYALKQSLSEVLRRHEILRATFPLVDGVPVHQLSAQATFHLPVIDLRALAEPDAEAAQLAQEEAQRPFDLARGPVVRATLLRPGDEVHVLLFTMHHIVSDGWSMSVLVREVAELYEAFSTGREISQAELPVQYADFAVWQRDWLQGDVLEAQLGYWKQQLKDAPAALELPADRSRPPIQTFKGAKQSLLLSRPLAERLKALSRKEGVTLFMALLAAFKVLLYRYSKQDDIVIGSPIANRNRTEIEGLIGFFVNTLALRTDLSGDPTFRELLRRVREVTLGAYAHQDLPFEKLVEELRPERSLSRGPLFQVMFALQNAPRAVMELPGLTVSLLETDSGTTKFDLSLFMAETPEGLAGTLEYNTDLFDAATISRMLTHLQNLLESALADPNERITRLRLLSADERRFLVESQGDYKDYASAQYAHALFEAQAERNPDAVALIYKDERLSYLDLNGRANQLAHYLRRMGVGPETPVGICMHRGIEMVVGLLAVLKAGGAYVPLDPAYPKQRIALMLDSARAKVILTQERLIAGLPESESELVLVDSHKAMIEAESKQNPPSDALPINLAYVIYTSGSTGKPKGVAIEHRSVLAFLHWAHDFFSESEIARVLASTSICFDLSVFELFVPLSWGGSVVIVENALHLAQMDAGVEVTLINTVPSAMAELVRQGALPLSVKTVNLGGEALQNALVQQVYESQSVRRVLNLYGPSEDTVYSTFARIEKGSKGMPGIGRPITNTRAYVLDEHMEPVPVGVKGELYLGGDGLARCYLNQPEMSAEKFLPDPFSGQAGARLYKTGDLASYATGGELYFYGRADQQVKLRGFRIEMGEIEAALAEHEDVREAVVVMQGEAAEDKKLVGYIVAESGGSLTLDELRDFLKQKLPEYMIPNRFVMLDSLPLTPNGKVDRRALLERQGRQLEVERSYTPPQTDLEKAVAEIWRQVLNIEKVGIHDNFFDLGGHSLLTIRVHSLLREKVGPALSIVDMFKYTTVSSLAEFLGREQVEEVSFGDVRDNAAKQRRAINKRKKALKAR